MADETFGLEIGDSYFRAADIQVINGQFNLFSFGFLEKLNSIYTSQNEKNLSEAAGDIEKLVQSLKIKKKAVNIIIPDTYTYSHILTMPYLKEKELLSAIKYQADQFIPLPMEETSLDLDILSEDKAHKNLLILVVAAPNNFVDRIVSLVEKAGLIPENLENQASSVCRLLNFLKMKQATIFVNFDYYSTTLYFYNPQLNLVTHIYNFKIGLNLFLKEIQVNYNLDIAKADQALKTIGLASGGSMNLAYILQPALNEFCQELEKFIISLKEKDNITKIDQIAVFNLANKFNQFEKGIQTRLGINTFQFDLSSMIVKNNNYPIFNQAKSAFISVLGEALK